MRPALLALPLLALPFLAVLVGAAAPTPQERRFLLSLQPPTPAVAEQSVREFFGETLRDPDAARYRFRRPVRAVIGNPRVRGVFVCGTVNGKNAYGGYTGPLTFLALFNNDFVARGDIEGTPGAKPVIALCAEAYRDTID